MKNITVTVDDELYRSARIRAAEKQTTVSALVRDFLERLVAEDARFEQLYQKQTTLIARIREEHAGYSAEERSTRDDVHDRHALR